MICMTQKELGELVGLTARQLRNIDGEQDADHKLLIHSDEGKYDAALFVQRWVEIRVDKAVKKADSLEAVKARHEVIKAEKTALEVRKMRGELLDVRDLRRAWGDIANAVMQGMIHLPATLAPMVQGLDNIETITGMIDKEIRRALNQVADTPLPDYAVGEDDAAETEEDEQEA